MQLYHDFGFLQQMRLSSAYFVNPGAADRAEVDLFIPIKDFSEDDLDKGIRLVGEGMASFSVVDPEMGIYRTLDTEFALTEDAIEGGAFGIVVERDLEDIFDKDLESRRVISWDTIFSMPVDVLVTGATRE